MNTATSNIAHDSAATAKDQDAQPGAIPPVETRSFPEYVREVSETGAVRAGLPLPLGVFLRGEGANFALFSRHATHVWLELFDAPGDLVPSRRIELDPERHRTGDVWHVWVEGVRPGQLYGYRVDGPYQPDVGHRFNKNKLLLDPYAAAITHLETWDFQQAQGYDSGSPLKDLSFSTINNAGATPKCVVTEEQFDWKENRRLKHPWSETVIYETHVRGLTVHPSSGVVHPGTFRGLIEKIPYLLELGVTAVELMPVQEFNERELVRVNPLTGEELHNYWGYNPTAFMAPNGAYSSSGSLGQQKLEFKEMVRALHRAGIEIILDVVFNHTAEGNEVGPTICWRGIDNVIYYILGDDARFYKDYTGTGNTVKADHPVVRDYILDALRYWTVEMHVDGFRFDLAAVLGRDQDGTLLAAPPLLERIAEDPVLRNVKLIAEAWDAAGAYQVGRFSRHPWAEWNGHYRDDVRRFWRGDPGMVGRFASRICGSADLYGHLGRGPTRSINYVACHDGFTLHDLVTYANRHNEANGEFNRDGPAESYSAHYGAEGETEDPEIAAVRTRQIKNFLMTLCVSRGVPMLLGGDEFRRTQRGNNNAYCQDNEISWYDWTLRDRHAEIFRFTRAMIAFRRAHPVLRQKAFYSEHDIHWYSADAGRPDWMNPDERTLACLILEDEGTALYLMVNAGPEAVPFVLPAADAPWYVQVDTFQPAPADILEPGAERLLDDQHRYRVEPWSSIILITRS